MSFTQKIKRAVLSLVSKDDGEFSVGQANYNGKTGDTELVWPYGFFANPPLGASILMFNVQGQEENRAGIASFPQMRFKNLKEGEVGIANFMTGSVMKFLADGSIEVTATNGMNITVTPDLNIVVAGNVNIAVAGGVSLSAGADVSIDGTGQTVNLYGSYNLGGPGGAAIARVGDSVSCAAGIGTIISGSSAHTAT